MEIFTITLNPAVDRTLYFDKPFLSGELNRAVKTAVTVGGKGINVSRVLNILGINAPVYGFVGGSDGHYLSDELKSAGLELRFTETLCDTRVNIKIIGSDGVCTEANEAGGIITVAEKEALYKKLSCDNAVSTDKSPDIHRYSVIGGSIPQGVEKSVYKSLCTMLKTCGNRVIIDSSGAALAAGMESSPFLIKPNSEELSALTGTKISTKAQAVENAERVYVETGVNVLCTLGGNGAVYAGNDGLYTVDSPQVTLRGFVGAGDTFLAAYLYKYDRENDIEAALRFASSAAAAKVELIGTTIPQSEYEMKKYEDMLTVKKL